MRLVRVAHQYPFGDRTTNREEYLDSDCFSVISAMAQLPLFSVIVLAKNEASALPGLMDSLTIFRQAGGQVLVADTGSTDRTIEVARREGADVVELGARFASTLDSETAGRMNRFLGAEMVAAGQIWFDFASARNAAALHAKNDMILVIDGRDRIETWQHDRICEAALTHPLLSLVQYMNHGTADKGDAGMEGEDIIPTTTPNHQHVTTRFYDRRIYSYHGRTHEYLRHNEADERKEHPPHTTTKGNAERSQPHAMFARDVLSIRYTHNTERVRCYIPGMVYDIWESRKMHRWYHYLGRELYGNGKWEAAAQLLVDGVEICTADAWDTEKCQSLCYAGQCYLHLARPQKAIQCFMSALKFDANRREPWLRLAHVYRKMECHAATRGFALAALEIPYRVGLVETARNYGADPHDCLYWAYYWLNDKKRAQEHHAKALAFEPQNERYLREAVFFKKVGPLEDKK